MSHFPDQLPDFDEQGAGDLMDTIQGFCNESTLPRVSIIGVLEAVKFALLASWQRDLESEDGQ